MGRQATRSTGCLSHGPDWCERLLLLCLWASVPAPHLGKGGEEELAVGEMVPSTVVRVDSGLV